MKNVRIFLSESFLFLVVKFSIYLKRPVFAMVFRVSESQLIWYLQSKFSLTSLALILLRPWKYVLDMDSSSHYGLIIMPGHEENKIV